MTQAAHPVLQPGKAYRTRDLAPWSANAPRLAKRLVREGVLLPLAHGLYMAPEKSRFGQVPAEDDELMRRFLDDSPFLFTGPERWNALGLGSTGVFALPLVYNTKRSGAFKLGGRRFQLRRVAFPEKAPQEWFVVDLFEHADQAGAAPQELAQELKRALGLESFNRKVLKDMVERYASQKTQALLGPLLGAKA